MILLPSIGPALRYFIHTLNPHRSAITNLTVLRTLTRDSDVFDGVLLQFIHKINSLMINSTIILR